MRLFLSLIYITLLTTFSFAQTDAGKITYKMNLESPQDTLMSDSDSSRLTIIYFLGDLTRTETKGKLGPQVLIRNLKANTGTLLITLGPQKLAISIDYNQDTAAAKYPYTLKNKCKSKKILDRKTKLSIVSRYGKEFNLFYLKGADAKYCPAYNNAKGLPLEYKLYSGDIAESYTCQDLKFYAIDNTMFDVPADYLKLTMEQFLNGIQQQ